MVKKVFSYIIVGLSIALIFVGFGLEWGECAFSGLVMLCVGLKLGLSCEELK